MHNFVLWKIEFRSPGKKLMPSFFGFILVSKQKTCFFLFWILASEFWIPGYPLNLLEPF